MEKSISKVSLVWVVIMVGFAMHMLADLLPLFWGTSIAIPDATGEAPTGMLIFMLGLSFFIPMCGLLCMQYRNSKTMRVINLMLAAVMMLFNFFHVSELFTEFNPVQLLILPVMAIVGVYLFIFSLHLLKQAPNDQ